MDTTTKLTWPRDGLAAGSYNWEGAQTYCQILSLDGSGWRLPNVVELRSLLDRSAGKPYIDKATFADTPEEWYWSATKPPWSPMAAWWIHFGTAESYGDMVAKQGRVRCVR